MSVFVREQVNTETELNWYLTVGATLTDAYEIGFQVWDIVDDPVGVQYFPDDADGWEDLVPAAKFATGSYFAYDASETQGWQCPVDARIGSHRIRWRWKAQATSPYRYGQEDFNVVLEAGQVDTYISVADVRAVGITVDMASDEEVMAMILLCQELLDRACRQWFLPRQLTLQFDGDNTPTAHFGVPIISVEYLRINGETTDLNADLYEFYTEHKNPKIALIHSMTITDIHTAPFVRGELRFYKGYKNQTVKGLFGCVDANGQPPLAIQRAMLKLVVERLTRPVYTPEGESPPDASPPTYAGVVVEEKTDGHSIKYGTPKFQDRRSGLTGITQDPEVLDIIKMYRAPTGIAMPSHWSYY